MPLDATLIGVGNNREDVNASRLCAWCHESLNGKRSDARFCDASCRVSFSRAGKRPRLTAAERSRCRECAHHKCYRHAAKPAKGRPDTTHPLPLFDPGCMTSVSEWTPRPSVRSHKEYVDRQLSRQGPSQLENVEEKRE